MHITWMKRNAIKLVNICYNYGTHNFKQIYLFYHIYIYLYFYKCIFAALDTILVLKTKDLYCIMYFKSLSTISLQMQKKIKNLWQPSDKVLIEKAACFTECFRVCMCRAREYSHYILCHCIIPSLRVCTLVMDINFNFWLWHFINSYKYDSCWVFWGFFFSRHGKWNHLISFT